MRILSPHAAIPLRPVDPSCNLGGNTIQCDTLRLDRRIFALSTLLVGSTIYATGTHHVAEVVVTFSDQFAACAGADTGSRHQRGPADPGGGSPRSSRGSKRNTAGARIRRDHRRRPE